MRIGARKDAGVVTMTSIPFPRSTRGWSARCGLLLWIAFVARAAEPVASTPPAPTPPGWQLVWADEFETPGAPNQKFWNYEEGFIRNGEAQFYTRDRRENARVENGNLILEARHETWKNPRAAAAEGGTEKRRPAGPAVAEYTSASLITQGKITWTYGRLEVRAKLPEARGTWPAIWLLGTNIASVGWPACGEIDVMEFVGYEPGVVHANIHTEKYNHVRGTGKGNRLALPSASSDFHVYALEWHRDRLEFFVDGQKYFTYANEGTGRDVWPFDRDHYLILNLAIGGSWGGRQGIDADRFPQRLEIDYVRAYRETTSAGDAGVPGR